MKNARELLEDFFKASWRDPKVMVAMFAEDGGLELPYLTDFGYPERFAGAEGITGFTAFLHGTFPGIRRIRIHRGLDKNRPQGAPAVLCQAGGRERQDQAGSRGHQLGRGGPGRIQARDT